MFAPDDINDVDDDDGDDDDDDDNDNEQQLNCSRISDSSLLLELEPSLSPTPLVAAMLSNSSKKITALSCLLRTSSKRHLMSFSDSPWYFERTSDGEMLYSVASASAAAPLARTVFPQPFQKGYQYI